MATRQSYGWRPSLPDQRDMIYSAPSPLLEALPTKIDLSRPVLPAPFEPSWNQGKIGACGSFTAGANLVFNLIKLGFSPVNMPSRLYIYYCARAIMGTIDSDSGVDNRSLLKSLVKYGWCDESVWSYSDRKTGSQLDPFRQTPSSEAQQQASGRKIGKYLSISQNLNDMKACLAEGFPFWAGFTVYESMETDQVEQSGFVPAPTVGERALGGHDVLIVGFNDSVQLFKFKNSWYRNNVPWGDNGYGYMPYFYLLNPRLAGDFWTVRDTGIEAPVAPPEPILVVPPVIQPPLQPRGNNMSAIAIKIIQAAVAAAVLWIKSTPSTSDDAWLPALNWLSDFLSQLSKSNIPPTVAQLNSARETFGITGPVNV